MLLGLLIVRLTFGIYWTNKWPNFVFHRAGTSDIRIFNNLLPRNWNFEFYKLIHCEKRRTTYFYQNSQCDGMFNNVLQCNLMYFTENINYYISKDW